MSGDCFDLAIRSTKGHSSLNDTGLYRAYRAGDEQAMVALIERYHQPVFDFLYRFTNNETLADDVSQEAFIRLMHYDGNAITNIKAWLFSVARNLATDFYRSAYQRREESTDFDDKFFVSKTPDPEQQLMTAESNLHVREALQRLPVEQRDVVILRFYHDLSLAEIAEVTQSPVGTVKSRLFHGLKRLKTFLESTRSMQNI